LQPWVSQAHSVVKKLKQFSIMTPQQLLGTRRKHLGLGPLEDDSAASSSSSSGGGFDFSSFLTKASNIVSAGSSIATNVSKTINTFNPPSTPGSSSTSPVVINNPFAPAPPAPSKGLSTGAKVGIGVGGAAVLGTIVYLIASPSKKSVKGLGKVVHHKKSKKK
jgi:hypothetical protein